MYSTYNVGSFERMKRRTSSDPCYWDSPPSYLAERNQPTVGYNLKYRTARKSPNDRGDTKVALCTATPIDLHVCQSGVKNETFAYEKYKRYKEKVLAAFHDRKIFTVRGCYPKIRSSLLERGWLEKLGIDHYTSLQNMTQHRLLKYASDGNEYEKVAISKMLQRYPAYFVWQFRNSSDQNDYAIPYRNRIKRARAYDFCTKEGLLSCTENSHWSTIEGVANVLAPNTYRLVTKDDVKEFTNKFRLTQCLSLLGFVCEQNAPADIFSVLGTVPISVLTFAINQVERAMTFRRHEDIDKTIVDTCGPTDIEWSKFIDGSGKIIKERQKFLLEMGDEGRQILAARKTFFDAKIFWPTISMDGYLNIWIVKPFNKCRAYGIALLADDSKIINYARKNCQLRYIVQKYIERPLLIYKTKFDIRQYFLITVTDSVNVWMYKDCYLRFSSQEFSLSDFREAVHLTNNSVQSKYANGTRDKNLPAENMWTLKQFEEYLSSVNKGHVWRDHIYPKMKANVISVFLSSLESMEVVANTFELYGCDFMIANNYDPVLIEVNSTPDMSPTTSITASICPQALEDLIKVVIDLRQNPGTATGEFELIYKTAWTKVPSYCQGLVVQGKGLKLTYPRNLTSDKHCININLNDFSNTLLRTIRPVNGSKRRFRKKKVETGARGILSY